MPKDFEGIVKDDSYIQNSYTQNRELSWLRFNRRVLEEAADDLVPPLERLKFISIFSSNLDEFFMVRVGSLLDLSLVSPDEIDNKSGLDPAEQLQAIYEAIPSLLEIKGQLYSRVSTLLAQAGVDPLELTPSCVLLTDGCPICRPASLYSVQIFRVSTAHEGLMPLLAGHA